MLGCKESLQPNIFGFKQTLKTKNIWLFCNFSPCHDCEARVHLESREQEQEEESC